VGQNRAAVNAGQTVEQRFGSGAASNGGLLFQGYINGPLYINRGQATTQRTATWQLTMDVQ